MAKVEAKQTEPKSFARRDFLKEIETSIQATWLAEPPMFEANAPLNVGAMPFEDKNKTKYFLTFPYPYMNGRLHLGHALSFCKCEFQNRYQKMLGKNVLLPFSFHCTGMPILAAANRMKNEIKDSSIPQVQHEILKKMGIDDTELPKFAEADYWLEYFPTRGKTDLMKFGVSVDWRRSFITTQKNPYYDAFIRWQFNLLKAKNKISYGNRPTIYSTIENQPCADHDRSEGEGVMPQEYTLIKIKMLAPFPKSIAQFEQKNVYLVAATLRPETMYGQTNCFILPDGEYGLFEMKNDDIFICSARSAKNLSYQRMTKNFGKPQQLCTIKGQELIGCAIKAPLTSYEKVYVLPMLNISMKKGTGVVTSVPSDAPDDYAALRDLQKKKEFREKYGLKEEQVLPFIPIPIIKVEEFGDLTAIYLCDKLKIVSQNDREKLKQAKEMSYTKGFNEGIMTVGLCKNEKVSAAKPKIKEYMIKEGMACQYWEPENPVLSRSGDDCVVALCDQWMIKYGEEDWKNFVKTYVKSDKFNCFNPIVQKEFEAVLDWLKEWACSRTFGQGTYLPWDKQFLIESLSDSTIYMAFYTISHFLQGDLNGSMPGKLGIQPSQLSDDVFDYVFLGKPYKEGCLVKEADLAIMRNEFMYWYPMDLRCSAKDLIKNHFTMSLYNHAAIWEDVKMMPKAFFCNGYVCVDGVKMSKSAGNFVTLKDALELYGADATRFTIADAGDNIDDNNFERQTAHNGIGKLFVFRQWIDDQLKVIKDVKEKPYDLYDNIFLNQINLAIIESKAAFESLTYREALKNGFHNLQSAKEDYLMFKEGNELNKELVIFFIDTQLKLLYPICPHFCDHTYRNLLFPALMQLGFKDSPKTLLSCKYPEPKGEFKKNTYLIEKYIKKSRRDVKLTYEKVVIAKKKKVEKPEQVQITIIAAKAYKDWQITVLNMLQKMPYVKGVGIKEDLHKAISPLFTDKKKLSDAMKFARYMADETKEDGVDVLQPQTPFNEMELLASHAKWMISEINPKPLLKIISTEEAASNKDFALACQNAKPGFPVVHIAI